MLKESLFRDTFRVTPTDSAWQTYYGKEMQYDFASEQRAYSRMIDLIGIRHYGLCRDGLYVMGGFYPIRTNVDAFNSLMQTINPGLCAAQLQYVDQNSEPKDVLTPEEQSRFHQGNLAAIDSLFPTASVSSVVLDHTSQFMDDQTVWRMMNGLKEILTKDGVVFMATNDPWYKSVQKRNGLTEYNRNAKAMKQLIKQNLNIIDVGSYKVQEGRVRSRAALLYALARKDSIYTAWDEKTTVSLLSEDIRPGN